MSQQNNRDAGFFFFAFVFAIVVHLSTFTVLTVAEKFLSRPQKIPVIYTVKLFESIQAKSPSVAPQQMAEPKKIQKLEPPARPEPQNKKPLVRKPEPVKQEKKVAVPEEKQEPPEPVKKKAVSLAPEKKKKPAEKAKPRHTDKPVSKKKERKRPAKKKKKKIDSDKLLQRRLAKIEAKVTERREEEYLKRRFAALMAKRSNGDGSGQGGDVSDGQTVDEALRRYVAGVWSRIRGKWKFPEALIQNKKPMCVIVVRISKDGTLEKAWFEERSQIAAFNVFAMKAVRDAAPFEPIPRQLGRKPLEIGVRFRPGFVGE